MANPDETPRAWRRERFMWGRCIRQASGVTPSAKMLAWALSEQFADADTGECWPTIGALAEALGLPERQIKRAVKELEEGGWLRVQRAAGRGRPSVYTLSFPGDLAAEKSDGIVSIRPRKKVTSMARKGDMAVTPYVKEPTRNPNARATRAPRTPRTADRERGEARASPPVAWRWIAAEGRAREWDRWLAVQGFPSLDALGLGEEAAFGRRWRAPFERPPLRCHRKDIELARRFFEMVAEKRLPKDAADLFI